MSTKDRQEVYCSKYTRNYPIDDDNFLLLNLFSGAIDIVDKEVITLIDYVKEASKLPMNHDKENDIISLLYKRGYFIPSFDYERKKAKFTQEAFRKSLIKPSFLLLLTYNCNFRCPYCYEQNLRNKPKEYLNKVLSENQIDAAFRIFDNLSKTSSENQENGRQKREIVTLYGGEPFLPQTMKVVDKIGSEIKKRNWNLKVITNGYNLEEFMPIICKYDFIHLQITLDGPPEIHNNRRFLHGKKPTFNKIIKGIEKILIEKPTLKIGLRMNVDPDNFDNILEFLKFCEEKNWLPSHNRIRIELSMVSPSFSSGNYCLFNSNLEFLRKLYKLLGDSPIFTQMLYYYMILFVPQFIGNKTDTDKEKGDFGGFPRFYNCGANTNQHILDPFGDIYTCWGVVGDPKNAIGRYDNKNYEIFESESKKWQRSIFDIPKCSECSYAFICGAGCAYRSLIDGKDHKDGYCGQFHEIFEEFIPRHIIAGIKEKRYPWYKET